MTTIEAVATVAQNGILQITLPTNILPGKHRVVVVIEEEITEEEELTEPEKEFFQNFLFFLHKFFIPRNLKSQ